MVSSKAISRNDSNKVNTQFGDIAITRTVSGISRFYIIVNQYIIVLCSNNAHKAQLREDHAYRVSYSNTTLDKPVVWSHITVHKNKYESNILFVIVYKYNPPTQHMATIAANGSHVRTTP